MQQYDSHIYFSRPKNWWGLAVVLSWSVLSFALIDATWVIVVSLAGLLAWVAIYFEKTPVGVKAIGGMLQIGIGDLVLLETDLKNMTGLATTVIDRNGEKIVRILFEYDDNEVHKYDFDMLPNKQLSKQQVNRLLSQLQIGNPYLQLITPE